MEFYGVSSRTILNIPFEIKATVFCYATIQLKSILPWIFARITESFEYNFRNLIARIFWYYFAYRKREKNGSHWKLLCRLFYLSPKINSMTFSIRIILDGYYSSGGVVYCYFSLISATLIWYFDNSNWDSPIVTLECSFRFQYFDSFNWLSMATPFFI